MKPLLPSEAPQRPESWKDVMADIEKVIMPGVSTNCNMINDIFYIYIYNVSLFALQMIQNYSVEYRDNINSQILDNFGINFYSSRKFVRLGYTLA